VVLEEKLKRMEFCEAHLEIEALVLYYNCISVDAIKM
jgi:hypothetical protein